jgi:hypothetical protein
VPAILAEDASGVRERRRSLRAALGSAESRRRPQITDVLFSAANNSHEESKSNFFGITFSILEKIYWDFGYLCYVIGNLYS